MIEQIRAELEAAVKSGPKSIDGAVLIASAPTYIAALLDVAEAAPAVAYHGYHTTGGTVAVPVKGFKELQAALDLLPQELPE